MYIYATIDVSLDTGYLGFSSLNYDKLVTIVNKDISGTQDPLVA